MADNGRARQEPPGEALADRLREALAAGKVVVRLEGRARQPVWVACNPDERVEVCALWMSVGRSMRPYQDRLEAEASTPAERRVVAALTVSAIASAWVTTSHPGWSLAVAFALVGASAIAGLYAHLRRRGGARARAREALKS